MLLEEFDACKDSVINPLDVHPRVAGMPRVAVCCYSFVTLERLLADLETEIISSTHDSNMHEPIYKTVYKGTEIALFLIRVGAPMSAAQLDEIFAKGVETVVVFGTCGTLSASVEDCSVIIPDAALRDEGTSFHYAPPSEEIAVNPKYREEFIGLLEETGCKYTVGKTWTTDAFYRETREKMKRRKEQGCICVDMECSANAAVADFRGKEVFQFFYAADNLDAEQWDCRSLSNYALLEEKDKIAYLALELAFRISRAGISQTDIGQADIRWTDISQPD